LFYRKDKKERKKEKGLDLLQKRFGSSVTKKKKREKIFARNIMNGGTINMD